MARLLACTLTVTALTVTVLPSAAAEGLEAVLEQARVDAAQALADAEARRSRFLAARDRQQALLDQARADLQAVTGQVQALEKQLAAGRTQAGQLAERLQAEAGDLLAATAVVRDNAREAHTRLQASLLSAQFPDWTGALTELADATGTADATTIERLWLTLMEELVATGEAARFEAPVVATDGHSATQSVVRVGVFNAVTEQGFVALQQGRLHLLPRQPDTGKLAIARRYAGFDPANAAMMPGAGDAGSVAVTAPMVVDPSRGEWLETLALTPTPLERLRQGGAIGYLILILAAIGLSVGLWRLVVLTWLAQRVERQLRRPASPNTDNPLGRVLGAYPAAGGLDDIELQLHEAVLREIPGLSRGQTLLKLLTAVTPLLGLLGTVTGMVLTFQAISLFGSGDPRLMADGISQALVTTILGLGSAIPLLFLHSALSARSRALIQVLDQESAGLVVRGQLQATGEPR